MRALGVSDNRSGGVGRADFFDALTGEFDVDVAVALPERHGTSGLFGDPRAKVFVRDKEDVAVGGDTFDNFHRVAARADDIGERFDPGRAIDVSDDVIVLRGMLFEVSGKFVGRAGIAERATGLKVGNDHRLAGVDDFRRLAHEMNPAESDDVGRGLGRPVGQPERIAHVVGQFLNFGHLIVVGENDRVALAFQAFDFVGQKHGATMTARVRRGNQRTRPSRSAGAPTERTSVPWRIRAIIPASVVPGPSSRKVSHLSWSRRQVTHSAQRTLPVT